MKNLQYLLLIISFLIANKFSFAQEFYHTGSDDPVNTSPLPGILLAGGQSDNNDAMTWFLERADGGDIVVIRASGSDGYNNYLYSGLGVPVNSVTSIVISSEAQANNQDVYDTMLNAEALFIAGGNQWNYVNYWKNTLVQDAINYLVNEKNITIGGTSAGLAVLGEVVYSAENGTVWSTEALENPYHFRVTLEKDFLNIPFLEQLVTDSHYNRVHDDGYDRKGRHVAFMARMATNWEMEARGIGVNEYTAVAVDENGMGRVFGDPNYDDYAYFISAGNRQPEVCEDGSPLTWNHDQEALEVYRILGDSDGSNTFDLASWEEGGGGVWETWYVEEGVLNTAGSFRVRFEVMDGYTEDPIQGATVTVEGYGTATTNHSGLAEFQNVEPEEHLAFQVQKEGYFPESGSITVFDQDVDQHVFLYPDVNTVPSSPGAENLLMVYPNPSTGEFNLEFLTGEAATLRVFDSKGQKLKQLSLKGDQKGFIQSLTLSKSGLYLLVVEISGQRVTKKLMVK